MKFAAQPSSPPPASTAQNRFPLVNPLGLIASSATAASGRGLIHADPAIAQRQQEITDWLNGVPQKLAAEQQTVLRETEIGARAQRARQRAFSSMAGYRGAGYASTIATTPLGLASNPLGKGNLGA